MALLIAMLIIVNVLVFVRQLERKKEY